MLRAEGEKFGCNQTEKDRKVCLSKFLPCLKKYQAKARCRSRKLNEKHKHSLHELYAFHWELNGRQSLGSGSLSHSSHLEGLADQGKEDAGIMPD